MFNFAVLQDYVPVIEPPNSILLLVTFYTFTGNLLSLQASFNWENADGDAE